MLPGQREGYYGVVLLYVVDVRSDDRQRFGTERFRIEADAELARYI